MDGHEEALVRTADQPVDGALVRRSATPDEAIVPAVEALDVELLPRFDTVHPPELCRQNDLALGGDSGLQGGKISSYLGACHAWVARLAPECENDPGWVPGPDATAAPWCQAATRRRPSDRGLGFLINLGRGRYDTALVFVAVFTLVTLALGLYGLVVFIESRWLSWRSA